MSSRHHERRRKRTIRYQNVGGSGGKSRRRVINRTRVRSDRTAESENVRIGNDARRADGQASSSARYNDGAARKACPRPASSSLRWGSLTINAILAPEMGGHSGYGSCSLRQGRVRTAETVASHACINSWTRPKMILSSVPLHGRCSNEYGAPLTKETSEVCSVK